MNYDKSKTNNKVQGYLTGIGLAYQLYKEDEKEMAGEIQETIGEMFNNDKLIKQLHNMALQKNKNY